MRVTTLLRRLLGISGLIVESFQMSTDGLVVGVRPRWRKPRCGACSRRCPRYDVSKTRRWRHLSWGRLRIWLEYRPRRVKCLVCGVRTEEVPWAARASGFTKDFEELTAYLARVTDKTTVAKLMGIAWVTVGRIVERVVDDRLDASRLDGLRRIGVDEFSYRRRHRYLTVVVDHDCKAVVWAGPGSQLEALSRFFEELGEQRCHQIELVTIDMNAVESYLKGKEKG